MSALIRWNPRLEMEPFSRDPVFRRFFDLFEEGRAEDQAWSPAMDLIDESDRLVARVEIPGIDPKNVAVNIQGDILTIKGERKDEQSHQENGRVLRREQIYGAFQRAVQLPYRVNVDKVKASCQNGIMTITMPKAQEHIGREVPVEIK
jgi:HSP20 family protein